MREPSLRPERSASANSATSAHVPAYFISNAFFVNGNALVITHIFYAHHIWAGQVPVNGTFGGKNLNQEHHRHSATLSQLYANFITVL